MRTARALRGLVAVARSPGAAVTASAASAACRREMHVHGHDVDSPPLLGVL
jgi:hypothetical protein